MSIKNNRKGFLRTCIDRRFVALCREAFEKETHLSPTDYWHESFAGGSAIPKANTLGEDYAFAHGATIFGWQAHGDGCGGQPGENNQQIKEKLLKTISEKKKKFPNAIHFYLFATEKGVVIKRINS